MAYNLVLSIDQALAGNFAAVAAQSQRLEPLWALFNQHGASIRVIAAAASASLAENDCLPCPLLTLSADVAEVEKVITELELA